jgi:predicted FMN-binding regulatory protein PaiB
VERIAFLEHNLELTMQEVEENDNWIDEFEPPKSVQDTVKKMQQLEIEIARIKLMLEDK